MFAATEYALLSTALLTALVHTLIPDHWLPFVLIGRARGWSVANTALISGMSALVHTVLSVLLGLLALGVGLGAMATIGERLERISTVLLIVFGVVYAAWAWRKGGHFHPGGARLHMHEVSAACQGDEGDANPQHLHYHADENWILGRTGLRAGVLALIIGANPCVLLLPIMLSAAERGAAAVGWVSLAYGVPAIITMVGLSALGVAGAGRIRLPPAARYMELFSGLVIAGLGLLFLILGDWPGG